MTKYFNNITTAEELKKAFHELAKKLHPDNGGDPELFKAMKAEFETLAHSKIWNTHKAKDGKTYEKENSTTPEQFANIIEKLRGLENITIEILGSWIWVTGDTRNYKDTLKELKFFFSSRKQAWYYNGDEKKRKARSNYSSYSDLKDHWGCEYSEKTGEKSKLEETA